MTDLVIPEIVQSSELQLPPGAVPGVVDHWLRTYIPSTQTTYKSTVAKYERLIGEPFEYLLASRGRCFATASAFRTKLMESGAANATVNRHLAALRAFVEHCGPSGLAVVEWALKIGDLPSKPYRDTHGPGLERVRGMFEAANASRSPERDRALMAVLFGLALRRGEVAQLGVGDFDAGRGIFLVQGKGQGGQKVVVRAPPEVVEAVSAWVAVRGGSSGALFLRARPLPAQASKRAPPAPAAVLSEDWAARLAQIIPGWTPGEGVQVGGEAPAEPQAPRVALVYRGRLSTRAIATVVARLARVAGATSKVRPHGLRHTAITEALKATGGDLTKTRDFSRHKDIRTVGIYNDNRENHGLEVATGVAAGVMGETKPKGSG